MSRPKRPVLEMACPKCGGSSKVKDSRPGPDGLRRRRRCLDCDFRWTTYENNHYLNPTDVYARLAAIKRLVDELTAQVEKGLS